MHLLFDHLQCGWVMDLDAGTATYNVRDAQQFNEEQAKALSDAPGRRYAAHAVGKRLERSKDDMGAALQVIHEPFLLGVRAGCIPVVVRKKNTAYYNPFDDEGYHLNEERTTWGYRFRTDEQWRIADTKEACLLDARRAAISLMTSDGWNRTERYSAYVDYLDADPDCTNAPADHLIRDINENPMFQLRAVPLAIGDEYRWKDEASRQFYRGIMLAGLISYWRHRPGSTLKGYTVGTRRKGRLCDTHKAHIRAAMAVFDQAYRIEVAGVTAAKSLSRAPTNRCALGGIPAAMSGAAMNYRLLFRAEIEGKQLVLIPDFEVYAR